MLNTNSAFLGQLAVGWLAALSLLVVVKLIRLKLSEMRKKRRMAAKGERFGLIQEIRATGKPIATSPSRTWTATQPVWTAVPPIDRVAKRWTTPAGRLPAAGFEWN